MEKHQKQRPVNKARSIIDMFMGGLIIFVGIYSITNGLNFLGREASPVVDTILGIVFIFYGGWRVFRGIKRM